MKCSKQVLKQGRRGISDCFAENLLGKTLLNDTMEHSFLFVHPPVLRVAPIGERNHGYARVRNSSTCWSVQGT